MYALALERFGFAVRTATSGAETIRGANEQPQPALIVLDLRLPDASGREVFRALQMDGATRDIPVIAVSGDPFELSQSLTLGFAGFCPKPCTPDTLVHAIIGVLMPRVTARQATVRPEGPAAVTVTPAPGGPWWEVRVNGDISTRWPSEFAARAAARQINDGD